MESYIVKAEAGIKRGRRKPGSGRICKYPWHTMEVGDSFRLSPPAKRATGYTLCSINNLKLSPKRFSAGRDETGALRIWRDE